MAIQLQWPAGALAAVGLVWLAMQWITLRHTPPLGPGSRRAGIEGFYIAAGPYRIFARMTGRTDSPVADCPVVLIHGLVVSGRYMEPLAGALAADFRVFVPDLPGFGESARQSPPGRRALSLPQLAEALYLWMRACGISRALLIGNSFGCQILAEFALRYPDAVAGLVLQGPTTDPRARQLPRLIWRDWRNGRREGFRPMGAISRIDYAKAGLPCVFATIRVLLRDRIETRLPKITAPTLVVAGSRDPVTPPDWAREVARLLPRGALLIMENATHTLNHAYPYSFAHAIRPFLADCLARSAAPHRRVLP